MAPPLYNVFEPFKLYVFQFGVTIWAAYFLWKSIKEDKLPISAGSLPFLLLLLLLVYAISTLWAKSVLLHSGALTRESLYLLFSILVWMTAQQPQDLMRTMVFSSALVSMYALIQKTGLDPFSWSEIDVRVRTVGTLGNPDYLSGFLALCLPFHLHGFIGSKGKRKAFYFLTTTTTYLAMLSTYARGGWVSFFMMFLGFFFFFDKKQWLFLAVYLALLTLISGSQKVEIDQQPTNTLKRIVTIADTSYPSFQIRKYLFKSTSSMVRDAPWMGLGGDHFPFYFSPYRSQKLVVLAGAERSPEHPHNEYLLVAAERGLLGLLMFLWLSLCALISLFRRNRLLALIFMGKLLQDIYYYPVTPVNLLFYALIGLSFPSPTAPSFSYRSAFKKAMAFLLPLLLLAYGVSSFTKLYADMLFKKAILYQEKRQFDRSLSFFEQAYALAPYHFDYALNLVQAYMKAASLLKKKESMKELARKAEKILDRWDQKLGPQSQLLQMRALLYAQWPVRQAAYKEKARELFLKSLSLDPHNIIWRKNLAMFYIAEKRYEQARLHLDKALRINPRFADAYSLKGVIAWQNGDDEKAIALQKKAIALSPNTYSAYIRLILLYLERQEYNQALKAVIIAKNRFPGEPELQLLEGETLRKLAR